MIRFVEPWRVLLLLGFVLMVVQSGAAQAPPLPPSPLRPCIDLFVYIDASQSMTKGKGYEEAVSSLQRLLEDADEDWLEYCVDLEVRLFAKKILDSDPLPRLKGVDRLSRENPALTDLVEKLRRIGDREPDEESNFTDLGAVFEDIRLESDKNKNARIRFLVFSDFAHDPVILDKKYDSAVDRNALKVLLEKELGEHGSSWNDFNDPNRRVLVGYILQAVNQQDEARQQAFMKSGTSWFNQAGVHFLDTRSLNDLKVLLRESLSPLLLEAVRNSTDNGWELTIRNLEDVGFKSVTVLLTCETELPPEATNERRSHTMVVDDPKLPPEKERLIPPSPSVESREIPDPFSLYSSRPSESVISCIVEVYDSNTHLGSVAVVHGVFIELKLDSVRPEFGFLNFIKPTARVLLKLRGPLLSHKLS